MGTVPYVSVGRRWFLRQVSEIKDYPLDSIPLGYHRDLGDVASYLCSPTPLLNCQGAPGHIPKINVKLLEQLVLDLRMHCGIMHGACMPRA